MTEASRVAVARIYDLLSKRLSEQDALAFTKEICIYVEEGTGARLLDAPAWAVDTRRFGANVEDNGHHELR